MPSRRSTTTTTNQTLAINIKGANDLKEYINRISEIAQGVRREFDCDVKQARTCVEEPMTFLGSLSFDVTMCKVSHKSVVHSETKLPQHSAFLQAEKTVNDGLELLENIRKMFVTNKQQRNVTVKKLKKTRYLGVKTGKINDLKKEREITEQGGVYQVPNGRAVAVFEEVELEHQTPKDKEFKLLIQQVQQNHRTVAHNLCKQAELIIHAMRTHLEQELADRNLTEEAVCAFEEEEELTSYRHEYGAIVSNSPPSASISVNNNASDDEDAVWVAVDALNAAVAIGMKCDD